MRLQPNDMRTLLQWTDLLSTAAERLASHESPRFRSSMHRIIEQDAAALADLATQASGQFLAVGDAVRAGELATIASTGRNAHRAGDRIAFGANALRGFEELRDSVLRESSGTVVLDDIRTVVNTHPRALTADEITAAEHALETVDMLRERGWRITIDEDELPLTRIQDALSQHPSLRTTHLLDVHLDAVRASPATASRRLSDLLASPRTLSGEDAAEALGLIRYLARSDGHASATTFRPVLDLELEPMLHRIVSDTDPTHRVAIDVLTSSNTNPAERARLVDDVVEAAASDGLTDMHFGLVAELASDLSARPDLPAGRNAQLALIDGTTTSLLPGLSRDGLHAVARAGASNAAESDRVAGARVLSRWMLQRHAPDLASDPKAAAAELVTHLRAASDRSANDWMRVAGLADIAVPATGDVRTTSGATVGELATNIVLGHERHAELPEDLAASLATRIEVALAGGHDVAETARRFASLVAAPGPRGPDELVELDALRRIVRTPSGEALTEHAPGLPDASAAMTTNPEHAIAYQLRWRDQITGLDADLDAQASRVRVLVDEPLRPRSDDELDELEHIARWYARDLGLPTSTSTVPDAVAALARRNDETLQVVRVWNVAASIGGTSSDVLRAELHRLLSRDVTLTADEWSRVRAVTELASFDELGLAHRFDSAPTVHETLERVARSNDAGDASAAADRIAAAWRLQVDPGDTGELIAASLRDAAARPAPQRGAETWQRVLAALDVDGATNAIGLRRSVPGMPDATTVVSAAASNAARSHTDADRLLSIWATQVELLTSSRPTDELMDLVRRFDPKDPRSTATAVLPLVEAGAHVSAGLPTTFVGLLEHPEDLLRRSASKALGHEDSKRVLSAWKLVATKGSRDADELRRLASGPVSGNARSLNNLDARTLLALADARAWSPEVALPRRLVDEVPAARAFAAVVEGSPSNDMMTSADRYLDAWRAALDGELASPEATASAIRAIVDQPLSAISTPQWRRLETLLAVPDSRIPGLPDAGSSHGPVAAVRRHLDANDAHDAHELAAHLRLTLDGTLGSVDAMRSRAATIAQRDTASLTADDWLELTIIGKHGPPAGLDVPHALAPNVDPRSATDAFRDAAVHGATTENRAGIALDVWRLHLDGTMRDDDALRALVRDLAVEAGPTTTPTTWSVIDHVVGAAGPRLGLRSTVASTNITEVTGRLARGIVVDARDRQWAAATLLVDAGGGFGVRRDATLDDGRLAAHFINRSDVPAFLDGSAWPHTVFHGSTNREAWQSIMDVGPDVRRNKRSALGRGFYTALEPGGWGDDVHEIALRTHAPLVVESQSELLDAVGRLSGRDPARISTSEILPVLRHAGYDSIAFPNPQSSGGDWLVGLVNENMRVVVRDSDDAPDLRPRSPNRFEF